MRHNNRVKIIYFFHGSAEFQGRQLTGFWSIRLVFIYEATIVITDG